MSISVLLSVILGLFLLLNLSNNDMTKLENRDLSQRLDAAYYQVDRRKDGDRFNVYARKLGRNEYTAQHSVHNCRLPYLDYCHRILGGNAERCLWLLAPTNVRL